MNEWKYKVILGGLDFSISHDNRGIDVSIQGYSQRIPRLLRELADRIKIFL